MNNNSPQQNQQPSGEILLYTSPDGKVRLELNMQGDTIWMTQQMMSELFQTSVQNIIMHVQNIYQDVELEREGTCKDFLQVRLEGTRQIKRSIAFYNLDMVISVGYRVNSIRGTQFRIWATQRLREYMIKGFSIDDERLKNPPISGTTPLSDHFNELLERIRDIRASERRMYLRIKEIFSMAADYVPSDEETIHFFSSIQNKLHYAITGHTAAELILLRADAEKPHMGLTTWSKDHVQASDITIAKNYLHNNEIEDFNRLTSMCLDFVEDQAKNRRDIFMSEWETKIDQLLGIMGRTILKGNGTHSKKQAYHHARQQYMAFQEQRRRDVEQQAESHYVQELENYIENLERRTDGNR